MARHKLNVEMKEMLENNLEENALRGKRMVYDMVVKYTMVYDELRARGSELHLFEICNHLRKSCRTANQRYKA